MTFEQADKLFLMILDCYYSQNYMPSEKAQKNILETLATGRFVTRIKGGQVLWYAGYTEQSQSMYVVEAVNCIGIKGCIETGRALKRKMPHMQGALWHRPVKDKRLRHYPKAKGERI